MADPNDIPEELLTEEQRKRRAQQLSREIAEKYDPERLSNVVVSQAGRGEHLDAATLHEMETRLGGTFGHVRVFRGPFAESVTKSHGADAVTVGNTGMILVREGPRSDPKTALGKALLAHELTHVTQAQRGLHFALEGGQSQSGHHEKEAEAVEASVAQGGSHGGGKGGKGGKGGDPKEVEKLIIEKVIEIMHHEESLRRDRLGHD